MVVALKFVLFLWFRFPKHTLMYKYVSYSGLSVDTPVGFSQSLNDLQSVEKLVGTFNLQQLLPAQILPVLHTNTLKKLNESV